MLQLTLTLKERDMILAMINIIDNLHDAGEKLEDYTGIAIGEVYEILDSLQEKAEDA